MDVRYLIRDSNNLRLTELQKEIFNSSRLVIKAIAKRLRKTIVMKHKTCVHRLARISKEVGKGNPETCPFAYAYVFWRQSIDSIIYYYEIDNKGRPSRRFDYNFDIASEDDREYILNLLQDWVQCFPITTPEKRSHLIWITNRVTGHLALSHFKMWLKRSLKPDSDQRNCVKQKYAELDFFVTCFPKTENESIEFHWMHRYGKDEWMRTINCPYNSVKKRRKKSTELYHHPLRLALVKLKG